MGEADQMTTPMPNTSLQIIEKLGALSEGIHRAYCVAVCVDYALLYKESDMDPEIAVVVREYLVNRLDALSYTAVEIKTALEGAPTSPSTDVAAHNAD